MVPKVEAAGLQFLSFYLCFTPTVVVFEDSSVSAQDVVYVPNVIVCVRIEFVVKLVPTAIVAEQLVGTTVKGTATFFANAFEYRFHKK